MSRADQPNPGVVPASRENAWIRVTLLWARDTNTVAVCVLDDSSDDRQLMRSSGKRSMFTSSSRQARAHEPLRHETCVTIVEDR